MQGTLVMLVVLSGLGCHNKGCDVAYGPPTYTSCFGGGYVAAMRMLSRAGDAGLLCRLLRRRL